MIAFVFDCMYSSNSTKMLNNFTRQSLLLKYTKTKSNLVIYHDFTKHGFYFKFLLLSVQEVTLTRPTEKKNQHTETQISTVHINPESFNKFDPNITETNHTCLIQQRKGAQTK